MKKCKFCNECKNQATIMEPILQIMLKKPSEYHGTHMNEECQ